MWFEVRIEAEAAEAELLGEFFFDLGAVSVSTQDADVDTPDEVPLFGEPGIDLPNVWRHNVLTALFSPPFSPEDVLAELYSTFPALPRSRVSIVEVVDTDWVKTVQDQFTAIEVTPTLWIVPSWCERPSNPQALVLSLDPGLAFGTGSHPTTRLCLRWLERHPLQGSCVLDYGCGSGILAIAAAKMGASGVGGVDIDPLAIQAAQANAEANQVVAAFGLPDAPPIRQADIVIANILANPLKELAPRLVELMVPGGWLVLSGILEEQAPAVAEAYTRATSGRLPLHIEETEDGWVCLAGQLQADSP